MTENPSFSIIIPTYNRSTMIEETVRSVLQQDYEDYEVIIVDDGSTDNTREVINSIDNEKVKYVYQANSERAVARNRGVAESKNDYVTFLDSDDVLYSNYLRVAASLIIISSSPYFVHVGYEVKDEQGQVLSRVNKRKGNLNDKLIEGNSLSCIGVFIQKNIAKQYPFNEDRRIIGSEDYELWMRLASRYPVVYSNEVTAALVQHSNRSVLNFTPDQLVKRIELILYYVTSDKGFKSTFWQYRKKFVAHRYLYLSLHLILSNHYKLGVRYWIKALINFPNVLIHRKTLGILANLLLVRN